MPQHWSLGHLIIENYQSKYDLWSIGYSTDPVELREWLLLDNVQHQSLWFTQNGEQHSVVSVYSGQLKQSLQIIDENSFDLSYIMFNMFKTG